MKNATFKGWTLTMLDDTFGIHQVYDKNYVLLKKWQNLAKTIEISDFEKQTLLNLQEPLELIL